MIWHRLKLIVASGTAIILLIIVAGTAALLDRAERTATATVEISLERSAQAVENALNRQLLQVHGALASLPTLFRAARVTPMDPVVVDDLLSGLNFQTLAYRDLLLVDSQGTILGSARQRPVGRHLPFDADELKQGPTALVGPVRNAITGDWSIYVTRSISGWNGVTAVAEVPIPTLMKLLAETGTLPGVRLLLERPNGQLIASLPHDELETGRIRPSALGRSAPDGRAFISVNAATGQSTVSVVRASLYGDARVVLTAPLDAMLTDWRRDRDATIMIATIGTLLIAAFSAALLVALRQREKTDAERARAQAVLVNAVEAMSDGFVMWDEHDRLVTCNERYRDLYSISAPFMIAGSTFEEIVRKGVEEGQYPEAAGNAEGFVARMMALHAEGTGSEERLLPDGRWVLMKERRTADGGTVGTRTDITQLKTMLGELGEANRRANEAAAEARRQNAALTERESRIRFLAHHDDLTRLPNRVLFRDRVASALNRAAARGEELALLYLDLDRFKDVNDTLGHPVGDALLQAVAARLSACVNDPERVARLGGDEFAVVSLAEVQPESAEDLSTRIIEEIGRPYNILGHTIGMSASIGIAVADRQGNDADGLLKQADLALYEAKGKGRARLCVFEPGMEAHLRDRLAIEADLLLALPGEQFELVYQPIYDLNSGRLRGFEALLRWHHPTRGLVSPAAFVPVAEDTRLIVEIGNWILHRACVDALRLPDGLRIAINLSPIQLAFGDIVESVARTLRDTGLDPTRLELEITETALFSNDQRNLEVLRRLKLLGVRIVLDDFGTGYSSLSHLHVFPLDKVKIDRLFVRDSTVRSKSAVIVEAIAGLASRLGMTTTAEGIETTDQWEVARASGCTEAQGYLLGKPLPIEGALHVATLPDHPCFKAPKAI
ncbi:EAL domain-containing protein [Ancylobacter sp. MQZ15Z-1]|uniref:EAL domain-containing protein n=1 Tax=Ancylobacter mangrovi TaxID=2972472 RepID=A0A9X2PE13_9HYPH|nr:EAL domain-containing protein [Ancylobacter mangrovi]MCS0494418.1 EAL domain-containing protein [Ancylobacter mangrovi]